MNVKLTKLVLQIGCPSCPSYLWIKSFPRNLNEHIKDTISGCWSTQTDMLNKAVELLGDWSFLIYWFLINKYWFWETLLLCPVSVLFLPYLLYLRSWALFFPVKNKLHYSELVNNLVVSYSDIFHTGGTHVDVGHENCSHLVIEDSYVDGLPVEMLQAVNVVKQEVKQFQKRNEFKETRAVCVSL